MNAAEVSNLHIINGIIDKNVHFIIYKILKKNLRVNT